MIVPASRLLLWSAIIVLPFALLGGVEPALGWISICAIGAFFAVVVVDGFRAPLSLAGIRLELPPVFRMSRDREAKLPVRVCNPRATTMSVRVALALPAELESQEDAEVALPAEAEWSRFDWPCVARKRGRYLLKTGRVAAPSPLGFWEAHKTIPAESEVRVYPNLATERKNLAALFLNRGAFGLHAQRQIGKGREFEKLREYVPGDSYEELHWKATARRGRPITKVFQIEKTQEVYVIIDASRLSARLTPKPKPALESNNRHSIRPDGITVPPRPEGEGDTTTLERFVTAALVVCLAAEQQGDLFGLVTFGDKVENFIRAKNGKMHYGVCRDALYTLEPRIVTPDFDELCTTIRLRLRRRALLVFLTALDDPTIAENFVRNIELIRRQHLVLVNMLQPPRLAPLFSDPCVSTTDELYEALGGHLRWHKMRQLEKALQRRGVRLSMLGDERLSADLVSQYLNVKRRQIL